MAWDRNQPTHPKYRTKQHRDLRAALVRELKRIGYLECQATRCLFPSRAITNADGRASDGLNLGHEDDGVTYRGPEHRACNLRDGAVRGRARQDTPARWVL